jgi:Uma2 family endonuclease
MMVARGGTVSLREWHLAGSSPGGADYGYACSPTPLDDHRRSRAHRGVADAWPRYELIDGELLVTQSPGSPHGMATTELMVILDVGVPDYFIVDIEARIVECWTQGRDTPHVLRDELMWQPARAQTPLVLALPELFDRISEKLRIMGLRVR